MTGSRLSTAPCPLCQTPTEGLPGYAARCPKCLAYFTLPRTGPQEDLNRLLRGLLLPTSRYRASLLVLAYADEQNEPRIAHALGLRDHSLECVVEVVKMGRRLRELADELDQFVKKPGPFPAQDEEKKTDGQEG